MWLISSAVFAVHAGSAVSSDTAAAVIRGEIAVQTDS